MLGVHACEYVSQTQRRFLKTRVVIDVDSNYRQFCNQF